MSTISIGRISQLRSALGPLRSEAIPLSGQHVRLSPLAAVVLLFAVRIPMNKWADFDIFWHLSNGRFMSRDGQLPTPDPFSWSMQGKHVALHSVQMDRLFYYVWDLGGPTALAVLSGLLLLASLLPFALIIGRLSLKPLVESGALLLLAFIFLPFAGARPHLLGVCFLGLLALLLERPYGWKRAAGSAAVLGLWVNLHGSFLFGFAFIGAAALAWWLAGDGRASARACLAAALGAAATVASPYGFELWTMGLRVSSQPLLATINRDWRGLRPLNLEDAALGGLIVLACGLGIWRRWDPRSILALLLIAPTINYARFSVFLAPILAIVVLECLSQRFPALIMNPGSDLARQLARKTTSMASAGLLAVGIVVLSATAQVARIEDAAFYPVPEQAVDRLLACGAPAPVWNEFNWGSYLIWRTDGQYKTSIDSRSEALFPMSKFIDSLRVSRGQLGYDQTVEQSPAVYALVSVNSAPIGTLPGWRTVYKDDLAVLSVRDGATWNCSDTAMSGM